MKNWINDSCDLNGLNVLNFGQILIQMACFHYHLAVWLHSAQLYNGFSLQTEDGVVI